MTLPTLTDAAIAAAAGAAHLEQLGMADVAWVVMRRAERQPAHRSTVIPQDSAGIPRGIKIGS